MVKKQRKWEDNEKLENSDPKSHREDGNMLENIESLEKLIAWNLMTRVLSDFSHLSV